MTTTPTGNRTRILDTTPRDRNGLEVLTDIECYALLRRTVVGRVGLCEAGLPIVLPVNYSVEGDEIMVCTGTGSLLRAASAGAVVVLEADGHDVSAGMVWSVVVRGVAAEATRSGVVASGLACWGRLSPNRVVRIRSYEISGRRVWPADGPIGCQAPLGPL